MRLLITGILIFIIYLMTCIYGNIEEKAPNPAPASSSKSNEPIPLRQDWYEIFYYPIQAQTFSFV